MALHVLTNGDVKLGKGTKYTYCAAKRIARGALHHARKDADRAVYENIDPKSSEIFRLANQMRRENVDIVERKRLRVNVGKTKIMIGATGWVHKKCTRSAVGSSVT